MPELMARVRALLRRSEHAAAPDGEVISSRNLEIDTRRREASRDGVPVPLEPKEFELLLFFARNPGQVFTRDQLLPAGLGVRFRRRLTDSRRARALVEERSLRISQQNRPA